MKIKIAIAAIALALMAVGAPTQTTNERISVTVTMSFNGTQASPVSQLILHDKDSWWWGVAIDANQAAIMPNTYTVTVDNGSTAYHKAYFTLAGLDGVPSVVTYYLYSIAACTDLTDASKKLAQNEAFGCVSPSLPTTTTPASAVTPKMAPTKEPIPGGKRS